MVSNRASLSPKLSIRTAAGILAGGHTGRERHQLRMRFARRGGSVPGHAQIFWSQGMRERRQERTRFAPRGGCAGQRATVLLWRRRVALRRAVSFGAWDLRDIRRGGAELRCRATLPVGLESGRRLRQRSACVGGRSFSSDIKVPSSRDRKVTRIASGLASGTPFALPSILWVAWRGVKNTPK